VTVGESSSSYSSVLPWRSVFLCELSATAEGRQPRPLLHRPGRVPPLQAPWRPRRPQAKDRICKLVQNGVDSGARLLLDGRDIVVPQFEDGNFVGPTLLAD